MGRRHPSMGRSTVEVVEEEEEGRGWGRPSAEFSFPYHQCPSFPLCLPPSLLRRPQAICFCNPSPASSFSFPPLLLTVPLLRL